MTDIEPGRGTPVSAPKLASVVAMHIEDDVVARGWPVGTVLGSETELLERYGVSRAVLREAVRIVEHSGAARMRRGPGGGLVVTEPNRDAVVVAIGLWLSYMGVTITQMFEVRRPLMMAAVRLAAERRGPEMGSDLLALVDQVEAGPAIGPVQLAALEAEIVACASNPAIDLFVAALADLGIARLAAGRGALEPALTPEVAVRHLQTYRPIVEAIAAGDGAAAQESMAMTIDAVRRRLVDVPSRRRRPRLDDISSGKLAERVAAALREDIEAAGWPIGDVLGSETDLIERYGVSRAVLREAVRILEHHGAVRTKRGPHGGLVVTQPDLMAVVRSARMVLEHERIDATQLFEARSILEVAATGMAARRRSEAAAADLRAAVVAEERAGDAGRRFMPIHRQLAVATGNPLFVLFVDVMGELVPSHVALDHRTPSGMAELSEVVHNAHDRIVEAVVAGDADVAERRMSRHLQASVDVLQ